MPKKGYKQTKEHREKLSKSQTGRKYSEEVKSKISKMFLGEGNPCWMGGKVEENRLARNRREYRIWRTAVYERDNYTCQECGERGKKLQADHIKPFAHYKELRYELSNGRTLCVACHRKTDTYGNRTTWKV